MKLQVGYFTDVMMNHSTTDNSCLQKQKMLAKQIRSLTGTGKSHICSDYYSEVRDSECLIFCSSSSPLNL